MVQKPTTIEIEEISIVGPVPAIRCLEGETKNWCLCKAFDCGLVTLPNKGESNLYNSYFNEKWYLIGTIE